MISEGLSAREGRGGSNQIRSKAEEAHVEMPTINVHLGVWIEDEGLRNKKNP